MHKHTQKKLSTNLSSFFFQSQRYTHEQLVCFYPITIYTYHQGWESILKKVKNKWIFDKSPKSKEKVDFDDTLKK